MPNLSAASQALNMAQKSVAAKNNSMSLQPGAQPQQSQPRSFGDVLNTEDDYLKKLNKSRLLPNGQPNPNADYSTYGAYQTLLGFGGV
jgi:hypothetical protein